MNKLKNVIAVIFIVFLFIRTNAFAGRSTVHLEDQQIYNCIFLPRSGNYSYATARCYSVYPPNGELDTYTKIQTRIIDPSTSFSISDLVVLCETDSVPSNIQIYQGYLSLREVVIGFRGNNPKYEAYADVYYNGN